MSFDIKREKDLFPRIAKHPLAINSQISNFLTIATLASIISVYSIPPWICNIIYDLIRSLRCVTKETDTVICSSLVRINSFGHSYILDGSPSIRLSLLRELRD